ncbi:MAG: hypothetical protein ABI175_10735 [Polyangiales bacterium]
MRVLSWITAALALGAFASGSARAEHEHGGGHHHPVEALTSFGAGVGLVAARYDTEVYAGDYQGVLPTLSWMRGRFGASAAVGAYRLVENGLTRYGVSDVVLSAQATLAEGHGALVGVALPVSLPTGDRYGGFGMGHVMVMPAAWGSGEIGRVRLGGSVGYGRAIGGEAHHDHGSWPLVDPMNLQELTWTANAYVPLGTAVQAGLKLSGGVPIGDGRNRASGGVRAIWTQGRVETAFEVQAGFAGDPFILRGLVESAVHF